MGIFKKLLANVSSIPKVMHFRQRGVISIILKWPLAEIQQIPKLGKFHYLNQGTLSHHKQLFYIFLENLPALILPKLSFYEEGLIHSEFLVALFFISEF